MLVELRDVEVHIEPETVLTQAIQEGDISIDTIIRECINEDGVESILDAVNNEDICEYAQKYHIELGINSVLQITMAVHKLSDEDKAKVLWQLLKCEG